MTDAELTYAPATELVQLIAKKQVSPVELTQLFLDRSAGLDPQLNSFLLLNTTRRWRRRRPRRKR